MSIVTKIDNCRGCGSLLPPPFLDLKSTPLANSYLPVQFAPEETYPLAVTFCFDCALVQLTHNIDSGHMFSNYAYFSSFSSSFLSHAELMASDLIDFLNLDSSSLVMEIGSNDGYLLQFFKKAGIPIQGIEPAANIAVFANNNGIPTHNEFFELEYINRHSKLKRANLIIANNVLAHVPNVNDFLKAVYYCLRDDGTAVFEVPYLVDLINNVEFDTIYHEHIFYYSVASLSRLMNRAGLYIYAVQKKSVHGGSIRVFVAHDAPKQRLIIPNVFDMLEDEAEAGILNPKSYLDFYNKVRNVRFRLVDLLNDLKKAGKSIAAYGAPAKGNTLLNFCNITNQLIDFTVDKNPSKVGLYLPGSNIPIQNVYTLAVQVPDYAVILPWNIADEVISQQQEYLKSGGRFIVPLPELRIV